MLGDVNNMYILRGTLIYVQSVHIYTYRQCFHIWILPIEHDIVNTRVLTVMNRYDLYNI